MHPILLRELKSQFRVKPSPTELYSSTEFFKVFDRDDPSVRMDERWTKWDQKKDQSLLHTRDFLRSLCLW